MKNLFFVIALILFYSCGSSSSETTNSSSETNHSMSTPNQPSEVTNAETNSAHTDTEVTTSPTPPEVEMEKQESKVVSEIKEMKDKMKDEVKEKMDKTTKQVTSSVETKPKTTSVPRGETSSNSTITASTSKPSTISQPKVEIKKEMPAPKVETPAEIKAPEPAPAPKPAAPKKITNLTHQAFDAILKKYVSSSGAVNYKGLKNDASKLDAYISKLEKVKVKDLSGRNEKMAFWINAYNAYTLKLITKNYPLSSITKLDGGKPWDTKWINLDGRSLSLNNIENDILRPQYKDARIHFAVNCAAKSCPPLLNKAWTAQNLESNFQTQTRKFVNDSSFNKISDKKVEISKIFEWYGEDFGNLVNFLNKYSSTKINSDAKINFVEYDWALNQ